MWNIECHKWVINKRWNEYLVCRDFFPDLCSNGSRSDMQIERNKRGSSKLDIRTKRHPISVCPLLIFVWDFFLWSSFQCLSKCPFVLLFYIRAFVLLCYVCLLIYLFTYLFVCLFVVCFFFCVFPFWAAAPKGSMTYAFTHMGDFLLLLLHLLLLRPPLKSQPRGLNFSLKAKIPVPRLKFQPWGPNPSLEAQILA